MKLGLTKQEKIAKQKAKAGERRVFAFLPRFCWNTYRYVWLEYVKKSIQYDVSYRTAFTYYYEIKEDK